MLSMKPITHIGNFDAGAQPEFVIRLAYFVDGWIRENPLI
jgi:hypothetical protein